MSLQQYDIVFMKKIIKANVKVWRKDIPLATISLWYKCSCASVVKILAEISAKHFF
jgi:hypothetical protein